MRSVARWILVLVGLALPIDFPAAQSLSGQTPASRATAVPAGTMVNVRLTQDIDLDLAQTGMTFKARVDESVAIDAVIVIPREAQALVQAVKVTQSRDFNGSDQISLKLNTVSFGERTYRVATADATTEAECEGKPLPRKVGGGASLGALVGGLAGGGEGALVCAMVGRIAGTAVAASGEEHLRLRAETRLQFTLTNKVLIGP
jgi:outer membrane lipoprotein SlyB